MASFFKDRTLLKRRGGSKNKRRYTSDSSSGDESEDVDPQIEGNGQGTSGNASSDSDVSSFHESDLLPVLI